VFVRMKIRECAFDAPARMGAAAALLWRRLAMSGNVAPLGHQGLPQDPHGWERVPGKRKGGP
jgi:hypothetical protein